MNGWIGTAFLLLAVLHAGLAHFAFKKLSRFSVEILAFLAGGLFFATMALPAQLDGEWVSLGWAIEGVIVAHESDMLGVERPSAIIVKISRIRPQEPGHHF